MEKDNNSIFPYVQPNQKITREVREKAREIVCKAKQMNKIRPLDEAFEKYPVADEVHKGKSNYYIN